jgi:hypothetical protein
MLAKQISLDRKKQKRPVIKGASMRECARWCVHVCVILVIEKTHTGVQSRAPLSVPPALYKPPPSQQSPTHQLAPRSRARGEQDNYWSNEAATMLGSRVSTIRDLLALAEPGWSPPSRPGGARVPERSLFAAGCAPRRRPRRPVLQKRKRTGAPSSTTGVPSCNPETRVGLMAAVAEPASARLLRVAEPARAGASGIVMSAVTGMSDNDTASYGGGRRVNGSLLACELCRRRLDDRTIHIYM